MPGLCRLYALRDEADPDGAVSVALLGGRGEALRSYEQVVGIMCERLGKRAYQSPKATIAEAVVLVTV